jgi:hypothetical protein
VSHHHDEDVVPYLLIFVICCVRFFRELADEDVLLAYSMSMSMSMADPFIPTTAAPSTAVPTSAPTIANVTVEASDGPSIAPSTAASLIPLTDDSVESVLASDARREAVSGSPASTAVVAMASAAGIILAALAIRRSRTIEDLEALDTKKDGSTVDDDECFGTEPSVAGGSTSMTV